MATNLEVDLRLDRVLDALRQGLTTAEIAEQEGVTRPTIYDDFTRIARSPYRRAQADAVLRKAVTDVSTNKDENPHDVIASMVKILRIPDQPITEADAKRIHRERSNGDQDH